MTVFSDGGIARQNSEEEYFSDLGILELREALNLQTNSAATLQEILTMSSLTPWKFQGPSK